MNMQKPHGHRWILFFAFGMPFLPASAQTDRHVVLFSLDGFAAFHLDNPALELPNIRRLGKAGVRFAGSETVFPSVTHPSHTTLITGERPLRHGVLANELATRTEEMIPGNSLTRKEAILTPTIFDAAKAKGLRTAAFMWPETVEDAAIDFNLVSRTGPRGRLLVRNAFVEELEKDGIPVKSYDLFRRESGLYLVNDAIVTMAACATIRKHKPHLTAIHLVDTDHEQHVYSPHHPIAQASLSKADYLVGQVVRAVQDAGLAERTTFVIAADHGFTSVYEEYNLRPLFARFGLDKKVAFYEGGWAPFIRLMPEFDPRTDQGKLDELLAELQGNAHVLRIFRSEEFPQKVGLPRYEDSPRVRGQYLIVGDIDTYFVWAPDEQTARRKRRAPAHGHGFLPFHPEMSPMLVLSGAGVKAGVELGRTHNLNVAPTIAALLGLPAMKVEGKVIEEALTAVQ